MAKAANTAHMIDPSRRLVPSTRAGIDGLRALAYYIDAHHCRLCRATVRAVVSMRGRRASVI